MKTVYDEAALQTQVKYFDSLFDIGHACKQLLKANALLTEKELDRNVQDKEAFQILHSQSSRALKRNGYNWVHMQKFCTPIFAVHDQ